MLLRPLLAAVLLLGTTNTVGHCAEPHWQKTDIPGITDVSQDAPTVLQPIDDNDVWAFGYHADSSNSVRTARHFDGKKWSEAPYPEVGVVSAATARGANDVWVSGDTSEATNIAHWDGKSWTVTQVPDGHPTIRVLTAIGDQLWATGGCCGSYGWVARYDGKAWHDVKVADGGNGHYLTSFAGTKDGKIWAAGAAPTDDGVRPMLDQGNVDALDTSKNPLTGDNQLTSLTTVDGGEHLWALGFTNDDKKTAVLLYWDGKQWTDRSDSSLTGCELKSVGGVGTERIAFSKDAAHCTLRYDAQKHQWAKTTAPPMSSATAYSSRASHVLWAVSTEFGSAPVVATARF